MCQMYKLIDKALISTFVNKCTSILVIQFNILICLNLSSLVCFKRSGTCFLWDIVIPDLFLATFIPRKCFKESNFLFQVYEKLFFLMNISEILLLVRMIMLIRSSTYSITIVGLSSSCLLNIV